MLLRCVRDLNPEDIDLVIRLPMMACHAGGDFKLISMEPGFEPGLVTLNLEPVHTRRRQDGDDGDLEDWDRYMIGVLVHLGDYVEIGLPDAAVVVRPNQSDRG